MECRWLLCLHVCVCVLSIYVKRERGKNARLKFNLKKWPFVCPSNWPKLITSSILAFFTSILHHNSGPSPQLCTSHWRAATLVTLTFIRGTREATVWVLWMNLHNPFVSVCCEYYFVQPEVRWNLSFVHMKALAVVHSILSCLFFFLNPTYILWILWLAKYIVHCPLGGPKIPSKNKSPFKADSSRKMTGNKKGPQLDTDPRHCSSRSAPQTLGHQGVTQGLYLIIYNQKNNYWHEKV